MNRINWQAVLATLAAVVAVVVASRGGELPLVVALAGLAITSAILS